MSSEALVEVAGLWKAFPRWGGGGRTTRDLLSRRLPVLKRFQDQRWALRDVSLTIGRGESVALIGANGAGKSTLLRLAAGLGRPTRGEAYVRRPLRALLSLGDVFDGTLSGRENAVTTAMVAGLPEREARRRLGEMIAFAELEEFADAPVRTYSEGMKLRLGMSVALQLPARVYIVDEVLAVGDLRFQERCLAHMRAERRHGSALLLASHDLDLVARECDQAVWLDDGIARSAGPAGAVVDEYRSALMSQTLDRTPAADTHEGPLGLGSTRFGSQAATIEQVAFGQAGQDVHGWVRSAAPMTVRARIVRHDPDTAECLVSVVIRRRSDGLKVLSANSDASGVTIDLLQGSADVTVAFDRLPLAPDEYDVEVGAYRPDWSYAYDLHTGVYGLRVIGETGADGLVNAPHIWHVSGCG